jgi:hypothetical protein
MTDDSEIVLNLSLTQAIRLTEAIASKVSQAMTEQPRGLNGSMTGSMPASMNGGGMNGTGAYPPAVRPGPYGTG